jgi:hypothetical protein
MVLDPPTAGASLRSVLRSTVRLSRGLRVLSFETSVEAHDLPVHTSGTVEDTTLVVVRARSGGVPDTTRLPLTGPIFLPTLLPMILPLMERLHIGATYTVPLFDPQGLTLSTGTYAVTAESLFVLSDSASFDATTRRWHAITPDTVRAWWVKPTSGPDFSGWIDAGGQLVQAGRMGTELRRLPYEVAFSNWKAESDRRDSARTRRPPND